MSARLNLPGSNGWCRTCGNSASRGEWHCEECRQENIGISRLPLEERFGYWAKVEARRHASGAPKGYRPDEFTPEELRI